MLFRSVKDPKHPENEGKVFLYGYGKKIFNKISEAMYPPFDDQGRTKDDPSYNPTNAINPFDFWKGANFKLTVRNVEDYPNYDTSTFEAPSALFGGDDAKIEELWRSEHSLKELIDPSKFKSYDELKARLDKVLGLNGTKPVATNVESAKAPTKVEKSETPPWSDGEDEEDISFFKKLSEED